MTLANWTRIFAVPTEKAGVYEISNIVTAGSAVTADEEVPENEYGLGFAIAFYTLNENGIDDVTASQYASVEFGMRNAAAWEAMKLTVGDKVELNNIIFTEEQFAEEGEDLQAAWLETEGTWKHRYWDTEGLGSFTKTPIYRGSKVANTGAAEGEPQYLAQDEFVDFVTYSTMTKVNENINYGDTDGNGEVDISDLSQLAQFIAGWSVEVDNAVADVDGNGAVDISDLSLLAQFIAGWSVALGPQ
jgi:hypothetical protein